LPFQQWTVSSDLLLANATSTDSLLSSSSSLTLDPTVAAIAIKATAKLFCTILVGCWAARAGILNAATVQGLSRLTFCIFQPALVFCSVSQTLANNQNDNTNSSSSTSSTAPGDSTTTTLAALAVGTMPVMALLQIAAGLAVGRLLTAAMRINNPRDEADVCMACTFGNSAPLPLVFCDSLFFHPQIKSDVTACISLYLLVWSPVFWSLGPLLLQTNIVPSSSSNNNINNSTPVTTTYMADTGGDLDGSKNKELVQLSQQQQQSSQSSQHPQTCTSWQQIISPPVIGSLLGVLVGYTPLLQDLLLGESGVAAPLFGAAQTFASAYLPATILVLAGSMVATDNATNSSSKNSNSSSSSSSTAHAASSTIDDRPSELFDDAGKPKPSVAPALVHYRHGQQQRQPLLRPVLCVALARFVISPVVTGLLVHFLSTHTTLFGNHHGQDGTVVVTRTSAILCFVVLMQGCMPPAQNSVIMLQLSNDRHRAARMTKLLTILYCLAVVPVTIHLSHYLNLTGITQFE
jgi:predicted permease